jgi:putative SOS response-associated peptidase YedK
MCGLYSFKKSAEEARALFDYLETPEFPPREFVAPLGPMAIVRQHQGQRHFALVRWGFVPSWAKDISGKPMINIRAESVLQKPTFTAAMKRRRCLIPADGFYEWQGEVPGKKVPYYLHKPDHGLFAFAGLWTHWMGADGSELETAAIITTTPNREVAALHTRMPVVLAATDYQAWLDVDHVSDGDAAHLLRPAADNSFVAQPTRLPRPAPPPKPKPQLSLF